jgi:hypothetical protein
MATTTFDNLITFSRGSNATVTGPNGLIQWAPSNLVTNSQDFEAAGWTKNSSTITANSAVAPDGTQTADTWTPTSTATTAGVRLLGSFTVTSGSIQTASIYVKSAGKRWFFLTTPSAASANDNCWFDLQNGVVGTIGSSALSATMTAVGNGWYRVTTTSVAASATNYIFVSTTTGDNTTAVTADGTGVYIWGAQLELGSTATTYNNTSVRNLLGFSETFDNAAWSKGAATLVTGAQANPVNGLFNAQKLMEDTTNAQHLVLQNYAAAASIYTYSIYVKAAGRDIFGFNRTDIGGFSASYNLATGTVRSISGFTNAQIVAVGNGWYRVSCMLTLASATTIGFGVQPYNALGATVYTGDGNSGIYIYGAQLSNSASLDPYVPTPGAAPSSTAYYGPRFDYNPVTRLPRGFLVEEARTNLALRSAEFGSISWTKNNATVTANVTTAPDGTTTAFKLAEDAATGFHGINQLATLVSGTAYTQTFFVKAAERNWIALTEGNNVTATAYFNLATGTIGTVSGTGSPSATIVPFGNGWYRVSLTFTPIANAGNIQIRTATADGTANYAGTVGSGVFIWGAQLEAGSFPTSYIPTTTSTVTRSADVATITGSLFSQWYGQARGTFVMNFTPDGGLTSGSTRVLSVSSGGVSNRVVDVNFFAGNWTNYNGTATLAIGPAAVTTIPQRIAAAYATANYGYTLNGGTVATDTSALVNSPTQLNLGYLDTGNYLNGHIRSVAYYPVRAADFQLQALTELPLVPTLDADFINNLYEA